MDLCVVCWLCEVFVFCLSSHLSFFLSGCKEVHWKYMLVFLDFYFWLEKQLSYIKHAPRYCRVTNSLSASVWFWSGMPNFSEPMRFQESWKSNNSKKVLVNTIFFCIWIYIYWSLKSMSFLPRLCQDKTKTNALMLNYFKILFERLWNLCVLDKLRHCPMQIYKDIWKQ